MKLKVYAVNFRFSEIIYPYLSIKSMGVLLAAGDSYKKFPIIITVSMKTEKNRNVLDIKHVCP